MKLSEITRNHPHDLARIKFVASVIINNMQDANGKKLIISFENLESSPDGKFNNSSIADIILLVFKTIDRLPASDYLWNDKTNMAHIASNYTNAAINGPFAAIKARGAPAELIEATSMDDAVIELERRVKIMNNPFSV
ncbi:hypothetical protein RGI93_002022 [Proteus mirabilis]|nr:hypothetical protein [Proteus mirabilis]